jgi:hypothetical protein
MDPASVIAISIALGAAETVGKASVTEMVKDAYATVKRKINERFPKVPVALIEEEPSSHSRRAVVSESLEKLGADRDTDLLNAAQALIRAVQQSAPSEASPTGVILREIEGANLRLSDIESSGTGVDVRNAKLTGDIDIHGVRSGSSPKKKK